MLKRRDNKRSCYTLAMMILSIIFIIKVPKFLEGIEKQLQISNSLRAEQMHKEALKDADTSDTF